MLTAINPKILNLSPAGQGRTAGRRRLFSILARSQQHPPAIDRRTWASALAGKLDLGCAAANLCWRGPVGLSVAIGGNAILRQVDPPRPRLACTSCEAQSRKPKYDFKMLIRSIFLDGAAMLGEP